MRVLFLVSSLHAGGAERVAATLVNAWVARGHDVWLVCCFSGRGRCEQVLDHRVHLSWLADQIRGPRWWWPLAKMRALRVLVRGLRPDHVVSFLANVNVTALLATRGLDLPVTVCERTDPLYSNNLPRLLRLLRRWVYPWADQVAVQTQQAAEHLRRVVSGVQRTVVLPNPLPGGLPAVRVQEPATGRLRLVALGRVVPVKQFDRLIEVFATLAPECPAWDLYIWGEGAQRAACQARVGALGLGERIQLPGFSPRPWQELSRAHAFVLTSRVEGFPNALLEAMAIGVPSAAYDCPSGPAEMTRGGRDALLVPPGDEAALRAALLRLMQATPAQRLAMGQAAARSVRERYGLAQILQRWDALVFGHEGARLADEEADDGRP